ncbi:hypothetical protein RUM44_013181 [Polyplax serrata]|uniref:Vacuolar protein n=1 Tax=Polyplax serrata TaxID=468196 RepID=A0ABR1BHE0_POLSC
MSALDLPPCPASLKQIQHYLKTASEHDARDIVIAYWCRLYALQLGLKIDKSSPDAKKLLVGLMDWLEKTKTQQKDNEAVLHDIPAQAHLENYALKLFLWADSQDRAANFNKNVVKAFYTAGMIYDVLDTFGEPTEEVQQNKKYAKWKAAYIHNCLKNGETPVPGPMAEEGEENFDEPSSSNAKSPTSGGFGGFPQPSSGSFDQPSSGLPYPVPGGNGSTGIPLIPKPPSLDDEESKPRPLSPSELLEFEKPVTPAPAPSKPVPVNPVPPESITSKATSNTGMQLAPEQLTKAQKYCKWAASALNYDDVPTAVTNLEKALHLLKTGEEL